MTRATSLRHLTCVALATIACAAPWTTTYSACLSDQHFTAVVAAVKSETGRAAYAFPAETSMADAQCSQDRLVALLEPTLGPRVGWKVAATSVAIQTIVRGGPTRGALLEKMLVAESATPMKLSALRSFEADLVLQVKDEGINGAVTPLEILQHLSHMVPFIELPNAPQRLLAPGYVNSPAFLTSLNSHAREGVLGTPVPMAAEWGWVIALGTMNIVVLQDGKEISRMTGAASLGNPLNAVAWLIGDLKASGKKLRAGDLISTGTFSPPITPTTGQSFTVRYEGLPTSSRTAAVSVTFN